MKITIELDLDNEEDVELHNNFLCSRKMAALIETWEDRVLRNAYKYDALEGLQLTPEQADAIEKLREAWFQLKEDVYGD